MITAVKNIDENNEVIIYCYRSNLNKTMRLYYFEKDFSLYQKYIKEISKDNPIFVSYDDKNNINGVGFGCDLGEQVAIKGLWGTKEAKREIISSIEENYTHKKFYISPEKSNIDIIDIIEDRNYFLDESHTVLNTFKKLYFEKEYKFHLLKINRDNFILAKPYLDKYYSHFYWNTENLYKNVETRDVVLFLDEKDNIKGVAQGVYFKNGLSEIFGVNAINEEDELEIRIIYTNHLLDYADSCIYFLDDYEKKYMDNLVKSGYEIESESYTYILLR